MRRLALVIVLLCGCAEPPEPAGDGPEATAEYMRGGDWPSYNRDLAGTRFSPLRQISPTNVDELRQAWSYPLGPANGAPFDGSELTPLVVDGVLYATAADRVVALRGDTGAELWRFVLPQGSPSQRGLAYWPGDAATPARVYFTAGRTLVALDAANGQKVASFGIAGEAELPAAYNGAPTRFGELLIVGSNAAPGGVHAYDVRTGERRWSFTGAPALTHPAYSVTVDVDRALVYAVFAGPAPDPFYGGARNAEDPYFNAVVALDAYRGEPRWHFQTVHHDLWDTDMPSAGALFPFRRNGTTVPAIAHVGKSAFFYVLDRRTGEPLHEVRETPVPKGDVPTEWYSPTQPIPVRPPPLARVSFTEADLVRPEDTTPEHAAACRDFMERSGGFYNEGPFSPFLYKAPDAPPRSSIQFPGGTGGVNWGGIAMDPTTGLAFATSHDSALVGWVQDKDPNVTYSFEAVGSKQPYDRASINGVGPFFTFSAPISGQYDENGRAVGPSAPCQRPPWGKLVAVNANTGEIVWESVLGLNLALPEGKQLVGNVGSAGPTVTAGGVVFVGATGDRRFRAFDARTGEELWSATLANNANANPMSYLGRSGRQRVAIVAGDTVNVFALP